MTNEYDNQTFFDQYAQMPRSKQGLAAGEWRQLKALFPSVSGKAVLDLGCGYGWHCRYVLEQGAARVLGLDISEKMLAEAERRGGEAIEYRLCGIEDYEYPPAAWDLVISNLALHYIADLEVIFNKVFTTLKPGGIFVFNIEHPAFTVGVGQDWIYAPDGKPQHWPIDGYFTSGERVINFLGCQVKKQHHTLTQILGGLLNCGFTLTAVEEARPPREMLDQPGMADELRRPMMLLVRAEKGT